MSLSLSLSLGLLLVQTARLDQRFASDLEVRSVAQATTVNWIWI